MSRSARLVAYAAVLGLMFGGGAALGAAIGPDPSPADRSTSAVHDDGSTDPAHESDH